MVGYNTRRAVYPCCTLPKSIEELFGIRRDKHPSAAASVSEPPAKFACLDAVGYKPIHRPVQPMIDQPKEENDRRTNRQHFTSDRHGERERRTAGFGNGRRFTACRRDLYQAGIHLASNAKPTEIKGEEEKAPQAAGQAKDRHPIHKTGDEKDANEIP